MANRTSASGNIYSNHGKFERKIKLNDGNSRSIRGITVSMEGRYAVALEDLRGRNRTLFPKTNDAESTIRYFFI